MNCGDALTTKAPINNAGSKQFQGDDRRSSILGMNFLLELPVVEDYGLMILRCRPIQTILNALFALPANSFGRHKRESGAQAAPST